MPSATMSLVLISILKFLLLLATVLTAIVVVAFLHEGFLREEAWPWFGAFVYGSISIYAGKSYLALLNYKEMEEE